MLFIALGLKQYGFHAEAAQIAAGLIDAGRRFLLHRLPEVFAGASRRESPFPVQDLGATVPQAWAAGTVFCLRRALLGAESDTAAATIYADPHFPDWMPEIRIEDFRVGKQAVDPRVWRDGGDTRFRIMGGNGARLVRRPLGLCQTLVVQPHERGYV